MSCDKKFKGFNLLKVVMGKHNNNNNNNIYYALHVITYEFCKENTIIF